MTRFLMFTLRAPLASFGAAGALLRRPSWERPARSSILGLAAACLGWRRDETEKLRILETGLNCAVRIDAAGTPLWDYHTIAVPTRAGNDLATRKDELESENTRTVISHREWIADSYFTGCLWARDEAPDGLVEMIHDAMRTPTFPPSLGRKSAVLGLPLNPKLAGVEDMSAAFATHEPSELEHDVLDHLDTFRAPAGMIAWDADADKVGEMAVLKRERRRDVVLDRKRWTFLDRNVHLGTQA